MLLHNEAITLLGEYGQGMAFTKRCAPVSSAEELACSVIGTHNAVDLDVLCSKSLLHNIGRYVKHDPVMSGIGGIPSVDKSRSQGRRVRRRLPRPGRPLRYRCGPVRFPGRNSLPQTVEQRIEPSVDFPIEGDRPATFKGGFAVLAARNTDDEFFLKGHGRACREAEAFTARLEDETGCSIESVVASSGRCSQPADMADVPMLADTLISELRTAHPLVAGTACN